MAKENKNYQESNNWPEAALKLITEVQGIDEQITALKEQRRQPFKRAKELGFHVPALRKYIKELSEEPDLVANREAALNDYREHIGALLDTPLGQAGLRVVDNGE